MKTVTILAMFAILAGAAIITTIGTTIVTSVEAQTDNMTMSAGNMTGGNMTAGNATDGSGTISGRAH